VPTSLPRFASPMIELRNDLGGEPTPCLRDSPFEVADVLLAIRDHEGSESAAARSLSVSLEQLYACISCHHEHPELIDGRMEACDFSRHAEAEDELFAGETTPEAEPRGRWTWRLATR
jgi:uncharacterized protein (DUF433 family)